MSGFGSRHGNRRIVVVGDITTDIVALLDAPLAVGSDTPTRIRVVGGGQGANTASWLARHGHPVTLVASVGDDQLGRARSGELAGLGVECCLSRRANVPTGTVIAFSNRHERTMLTDRGANRLLAPADIDAALAQATDASHLHLSGYVLLDEASGPAGRHALAAARRRGLTVSVDAASTAPTQRAGIDRFRSWLGRLDLFLANADEAELLTGQPDPVRAAAKLTMVADAVVVKRGAAGAVWLDNRGRLVEMPALPVEVVDTLGAGDAFAAGMLAALVDGHRPTEALRHAIAFGAAAASRVGGSPSYADGLAAAVALPVDVDHLSSTVR